MTGVVVRSRSGFVDVLTDEGRMRCRLRGRLKNVERQGDLCVIGDRVRVERSARGEPVVAEVFERERAFSRQKPGSAKAYEDVLIANLDRLVLVFSYGEPVLHPRMLDRFLVTAEHQGVTPIIVANKVDLATAEEREVFAAYRELGYPLIETDARTGRGIAELEHHLETGIAAFVGPSGVGKSSLLNALEPGLGLRVASVGKHQKGRHTTRVAELHRLRAGGLVADTPGIRAIGLWGLPKGELDRYFAEMRPFVGGCAFRGCQHRSEPGCAIKAAVEEGEISPSRYESYLRLIEES